MLQLPDFKANILAMSELVNTFSWSISAARDFAECPRRRYWSKYAMWNGWSRDATRVQRSAYRLSKMDNRFTLLGNAVERAVLWMIRRMQQGGIPSCEEAYDESARPFMNRCWLESRKRMWEADPKKFCCLHEHYYPEHHNASEKEMASEVADRIKLCLSNFAGEVLPRLEGVAAESELPIGTIGRGDPESLEVEGVKVYAIPDYACRRGEQIHIHEWKSGKPQPFHCDQLALYGMWANVKHNAEVGSILVHLEYLLEGEVRGAVLTDADIERMRGMICRSAGDMAAYLLDGDIAGNRPLPRECWDMTAEPEVCRRCNFHELCEPELG